MSDLVEVRIPTYRRPKWLEHAITTLLEQDYQNWKAIVFDDSLGQEGKEVVARLNDHRIVYRANAGNLGASGNLNQAFQTKAYFDGRYACVLEDDNWLLPGYLSENVKVLKSSKYKILHRNQQIWSRFTEVPAFTSATTLSNWYLPGELSSVHLHAYSLLFPGISNGALFWDTHAVSDLQISSTVKDSTLQECCRCQSIIEPSVFVPECLAVYADVPISQCRQPEYSGRQHTRFVSDLWRQVIHKHGKEVIEEASAISRRVKLRYTFERNLCFINERRFQREAMTVPQCINAVVRGYASRLLVENPIPGYCIPEQDMKGF